MNFLPDCHLHSFHSSDSDCFPKDIVNTAIQRQLPAICFTDHNDFLFPPENGVPEFQLDFDTYYHDIAALREQYQGSYPIYIGVEQGLLPAAADKINAYDQNHVLDFIIGSSHLVYGQDPYYPQFWNDKNISDTITAYYQSIIDNINICSNFDVYGHIDYITRYIPDKHYHYTVDTYMDYIDIILKKLIEKGKGIEINTAGIRYGANTNPEPAILKRYCQLGGEIITIGSDAHKLSDIGSYMDVAKDILSDCGFCYYTIFVQRKAQFFKL